MTTKAIPGVIAESLKREIDIIKIHLLRTFHVLTILDFVMVYIQIFFFNLNF